MSDGRPHPLCNRESPCNHCTRRQCEKDCIYSSDSSAPGQDAVGATRDHEDGRDRSVRHAYGIQQSAVPSQWLPATEPSSASGPPALDTRTALINTFGYSEGSASNTLAFVERLGLAGQPDDRPGSPRLSPTAVDAYRHVVGQLPDRPVLDFIVHHFVAEIDWMDQLVHVPWFTAQYDAFWRKDNVASALEVDLAVLILRICSYTLRFLPSPGYAFDKIRGVSLVDARRICDETGHSLEALAKSADSRGSLVRIQHMAYFALLCRVEEHKVHTFRDVLGQVIHAADDLGVFRGSTSRLARESAEKAPVSTATRSQRAGSATETEMETKCRIAANLFIWDSALARQTCRSPMCTERLPPEMWSHLRDMAAARISDSVYGADDAPNPFMERVLQAELADYWLKPRTQNHEHDTPRRGYEAFELEYSKPIPEYFALKQGNAPGPGPHTTWDRGGPKLHLQRALFHLAVYDWLLWYLCQTLLLRHDNRASDAVSARELHQTRCSVACTALRCLEATTQTQALMAASGCRSLPGTVTSTFDAAVALGYLLSTEPGFLPEPDPPLPRLVHQWCLLDVQTLTMAKIREALATALEQLLAMAKTSTASRIAADTLSRVLATTPDTDIVVVAAPEEQREYADIQMVSPSDPVEQVARPSPPLSAAAGSPLPPGECIVGQASKRFSALWIADYERTANTANGGIAGGAQGRGARADLFTFAPPAQCPHSQQRQNQAKRVVDFAGF